MRVAFLGLGAMGFPIARNLQREHQVLVWNRTVAVAERHAREHGTQLLSTLQEAAGADVIVTMVPTSHEVDELVEVLHSHLKPGSLWIDATSGDPVMSRRTAERLAGLSVEFVDAPVTGGAPGAEKGTLTIMVGGTDEAFRRAEAILRPTASKVVHVGDVGAGHALKAINNAMLGANLWMAAEGLLLARRFGIALPVALDVLNAGSGRSNATENLLPSRILEREWPLTFKLALHDKDVRIAASMAHQKHLVSPMLALTSQMFTAALHDMPDADYVEVVKYAASMSSEEW